MRAHTHVRSTRGVDTLVLARHPHVVKIVNSVPHAVLPRMPHTHACRALTHAVHSRMLRTVQHTHCRLAMCRALRSHQHGVLQFGPQHAHAPGSGCFLRVHVISRGGRPIAVHHEHGSQLSEGGVPFAGLQACRQSAHVLQLTVQLRGHAVLARECMLTHEDFIRPARRWCLCPDFAS